MIPVPFCRHLFSAHEELGEIVAMVPLTAVGTWGAQEWGAAATVGAVVLAALAAYLSARDNRDILKEMKLDREEKSRPQVFLYFTTNNSTQLFIRIANHGGPASSVRILFDQPLINSLGSNISDSPEFYTGLSLVPPGFQHDVFFDLSSGFFDVAYYLGNRRARTTAMISCRDPYSGRRFPDSRVVLDVDFLSPVGFDSARPVEYASFWESCDSWHDQNGNEREAPSESASQLLKSAQDELIADFGVQMAELTDPYGSDVLKAKIQSRGWHIVLEQYKTIAVKRRGPHQGIVVQASGWSRRSVLTFLALRAFQLDRQNSDNGSRRITREEVDGTIGRR